jgi:hypothetical protein
MFANKIDINIDARAYDCFEAAYLRRKFDTDVTLTTEQTDYFSNFESVRWTKKPWPCADTSPSLNANYAHAVARALCGMTRVFLLPVYFIQLYE